MGSTLEAHECALGQSLDGHATKLVFKWYGLNVTLVLYWSYADSVMTFHPSMDHVLTAVALAVDAHTAIA